MSYKQKVQSVFNDEHKMLFMFLSTFLIMLLAAVFFREEGVAKYHMVAMFVFLLGLLWLYFRFFIKPILCCSCHKDVRPVIMLLGKKSNQGFCPYCGDGIT